MKKISFHSLIILFIAFIILSCSNKTIQKELKMIDSLSQVLKQTDKFLIITPQVEKFNSEVQGNMNSFNLKNKDTLSYMQSQLWTDYYMVGKVYSKYLKQAMSSEKEVVALKKQLDDLKHDLENNLINPAEFNDYILSEQKDIFFIFNKTEEYYNAVLEHNKSLEKLKPLIKGEMYKMKDSI